MLSFADVGEAVETAAEFDDSPFFTQGVKRVRMHPQRDWIASAQGPAVVAENLESSRIAWAFCGRSRPC
jgi:hypothetical protein